jgi:hypothetical protein
MWWNIEPCHIMDRATSRSNRVLHWIGQLNAALPNCWYTCAANILSHYQGDLSLLLSLISNVVNNAHHAKQVCKVQPECNQMKLTLTMSPRVVRYSVEVIMWLAPRAKRVFYSLWA